MSFFIYYARTASLSKVCLVYLLYEYYQRTVNAFKESWYKNEMQSIEIRNAVFFLCDEFYQKGIKAIVLLKLLLKAVIKGALSGLRQFLANESPLNMMKSPFYFTLKALFVLFVLETFEFLF